MAEKSFADRALGLVLYALPIIFLTVTYIFMTVTAEDVLQGAGAGGSSIYGASWAFGYNSRLSDIYTYAVICKYDYQFSFGPDIIFRLIDVGLSAGLIYLISALILGGRPRLRLWDGLVFAAVFLAIFLNPRCDSLWLALSHIHNYLFIGFFSMLLLLPFGLRLQGKKLPEDPVFLLTMAVLGFLFGFASNLTPAAFLATLFCAVAFLLIKNRGTSISSVLRSWEFATVPGILAACVLMYGFGNGVSHYTSGGYSDMTDYLMISTVFESPLWLLRHIVENMRIMAPYLVLMAFCLIFELAAYRQGFSRDKGPIWFSIACLLFVLLHTLAASQILISSIIRLAMPAHFAAIAGIGFTALRMLRLVRPPRPAVLVSAVLIALLSLSVVTDMARFRYKYNNRAAEILEDIRTSEGSEYRISRTALAVPSSSVFGFTQYPLMQDWTLTQSIYGKTIILTDGEE